LLCLAFCPVLLSQGQRNPYDSAEKELTTIYSKIFSFYYSNYDSLDYYSDLFGEKFSRFIKENPATMKYPFKMLSDSNVCRVVTSKDGNLRLYSWDTWQGGTMHEYQNIYQYRSNEKIYIKAPENIEGEMGTMFIGIDTLTINGKPGYLIAGMGSESSRLYYESINYITIENNQITDTLQIFKAPEGNINYLVIEYDVSSRSQNKKSPLRLIKYNAEKKFISVPEVGEHEMLTGKYIRWKFVDGYFEALK
jgi:hypothetical protein